MVEIGTVIAHIATEGEDSEVQSSPAVAEPAAPSEGNVEKVSETAPIRDPQPASTAQSERVTERELRPGAVSGSDRFYSPLVRSIAAKEGITAAELESIGGSGMNGRVTKNDILAYLDNRSEAPQPVVKTPSDPPSVGKPQTQTQTSAIIEKGVPKAGPNEELIEMDRMRKMIAHHMVESKRISPHVTSFVEADVTNLVNWRNSNKNAFQAKYGEKITFTPIFMEAVCKAIRDYPMINISVQGDHIIKKNNVNLGMATALPSGNLIVPVIKNADRLNLAGLAAAVNDLALRARENKLQPDEIQGGTFSLTNVGTFGNVMGTPIIPQPQVAILATGAIRKRPAVVETEYGDVIAVRQMMFLSLSYDHRVVDGFLGGSFVRRVADYLEQFDADREV